ncbi:MULTISPECIES: hypothetical protein [Leptospira]|uniref:Uncharacterized protein n=1 Tax=Leptospira santarosai TaxID=28183 RepID=A0AB73MP10_9LEPT|nr:MULTISPECIES: hypothetical protein [Leptospira]AVV48642.1 Uncharacterized protein XB17_00017 [Leptospira santarosai]EKO78460.1 hypothetical protein LEP1GSC068_3556 [Leptospira sp. Fiocruz LV3954]EMI61602.1 hypothetical protein LEP1GSC076_3637 [Leptospira sp. Fiocruz LV4135]MDI7218758.1 hypothetical protein [Leptospira santarosai]ONF94440.1 hypothetical protein BWD14_04100 [Leptospira santarosai]
MNHSDIVEKLPSSIYKKDIGSGTTKFWSLVATPANELEAVIIPSYDIDNQVGAQLDKIGKTFGIERLGVSDDLYRDKILNSSINQFITIPALKDLLLQYSNNPTVREMCYPIEFEWDTLDGSDFLDGTGVFEPAMRVANELFFDGNGAFDGLDILDPTKVRPSAIEIDIGNLSQGALTEAFDKISKATLGITIYIKHFKEMG